MADFYALTGDPLPKALHGVDGDFSIRTLSDRERLAIEDYFASKGIKVALKPDDTAVIVPQSQTANATLEAFAVLIEFVLGILTVSGFQPITIVATLTSSSCTDAARRAYQGSVGRPTFPKKLVNAAAITWVRHFFAARHKTKDKLHITADRFVRYSREDDSRDGLLDLCICLESLIESQTEIAFRFSMCLAKVGGLNNAKEVSGLLSDLYDLRSRMVHGADSNKEHKRIAPNVIKLRLAARAILTAYILYLVDHTKEEWKEYLKSSLFG